MSGTRSTLSSFHKYEFNLIPAWISDSTHYKVWDEITYPFPNFNDVAVEVWEWISHFIPDFTEHLITYPCWGIWSYEFLLVWNRNIDQTLTGFYVTGRHCTYIPPTSKSQVHMPYFIHHPNFCLLLAILFLFLFVSCAINLKPTFPDSVS